MFARKLPSIGKAEKIYLNMFHIFKIEKKNIYIDIFFSPRSIVLFFSYLYCVLVHYVNPLIIGCFPVKACMVYYSIFVLIIWDFLSPWSVVGRVLASKYRPIPSLAFYEDLLPTADCNRIIFSCLFALQDVPAFRPFLFSQLLFENFARHLD